MYTGFSVPPFGKETAPKMKTIFDFEQFHAAAYFLDTQCKPCWLTMYLHGSIVKTDRMPVPLGKFISKHVYDSKLKSEHKITAKSCVRFIDVRKGEEKSAGSSWKVHIFVYPGWRLRLRLMLACCRM